ncbi:hypothetical protein [Chryseobacterium sp. 2R14A]|uniref:hypothetical protein n=1 Tax=Chryseobacterium sp. 2R14A TaxID=3380353 RepID=UPI003CF839FA
MQKLFIQFFILISGLLISQQKYYILFDNSKDEIIYFYHNKSKNIEGFNVCIDNKKYIKFLPSDIKSNYTKNTFNKESIISRTFLNKLLKEDTPSKENKYIIVIKTKSMYKYYFVDHIFRTIRD